MSYEIILADGATLLLCITAATFKNWNVWKIQFKDGNEVMLYKCGSEWVQRNEDDLDARSLIGIGKHIDGINAAKLIS
jgi:hypothetical protein